MARIVVSGYMIRHPVAGNLLAYFHYILGLHRLGHEVVYLEESGWPQACYNPITRSYSDNPGAGLRAVQALMNEYGVKATVCYVNRDTGKIYGVTRRDLKQLLRSADFLLNIGGVCWLPEFLLCERRALIDMDPFFTQIGQFGDEGREHYQTYFSYGINIGHPSCTIPTNDIDWLPTVPPVVLEIWSGSGPIWEEHQDDERMGVAFTTVANWSAYGPVTYCGQSYGQKDVEFLRMLDLPNRTSQKLELAISGADSETWARLQAAGWSVREGGAVSNDMQTYRSYITSSRAEFSAAKNGYVKTRSGWFSDRSVCYLAAGRPVILQDTGFTDWLSSDYGVLTFSSLEEAVVSIERINSDYMAHARAAREIAEGVFSYKAVLPRLIDAISGA